MRSAGILLIGIVLSGCGALPRDRQGTLERLRTGGDLRAGAATHQPWVIADDGRPTVSRSS